MQMGYPKQGSKNRFILQCNKFNKTVIFEPHLEVSEEDNSSPMPPIENATSIQDM